MPKKKSSEIAHGEMTRWVNDALTFIEGPSTGFKSKNSNTLKNSLSNQPVDQKKAAKKAKQKLKKEENKLLNELNELKEQFHVIYFKEYEAKIDLKEYKNSKKLDKKKMLAKETYLKKLKKTKLKLETNILESIGNLKIVNSNFKFSYLPTKEEQQDYVSNWTKYLEDKSKPEKKYQTLSKNIPLELNGSSRSICCSGSFKPSVVSSNLFSPDGLEPMFPTNPNYFNESVFSNASKENNTNNSKDITERIVTIRRVYLPDNEAQVTVTAKGNSPDQDKLLYTFVNGQLVPAVKVQGQNSKRSTNKDENKLQCPGKCNNINVSDHKLSKSNIKTIYNYNSESKEKFSRKTMNSTEMTTNETFNENNHNTQLRFMNNKEIENNLSKTCELKDKSFSRLRRGILVNENLSTELNGIIAKEKNKKSKKKKSSNSGNVERHKKNTTNMVFSKNMTSDNNLINPIQLNFGENDVLTLVNLNKNNEQQIFNGQNYDCNNIKNSSKYKFNNHLEELFPAIKNLSLNSTNDSSLSNNKAESPSIMEQLKQGVNVENLKLPPGISLTKVDPAKSQAIKAKQCSIQKISHALHDTKQLNKPQFHQSYAPIYPNIEVTPHIMHHDSSGLIMIDTNRTKLFQQHEQQIENINGVFNQYETNAYQKSPILQNLEQPYKRKTKKKKKKKMNSIENQITSSNIITLKNPMFKNMSSVNSTTRFIQPTIIDDQPAQITKNENGMFTIRNTALQENFLARFPYAGPGGILIPSNNLGSPSSNNCKEKRKSNYLYPQSMPFQESMKDHVCEPNGF